MNIMTKLAAVSALSLVAASSPAFAVGQFVEGYLYTSLNGEGINQIVSFERYANGSLGGERTYATGSLGGANRSVGGDAVGDFDSQGALQIIGDNLLAVNAGGNTVSVFAIDREDGGLTLRENVDSGGTRPVSIAFTPKDAGGNDYWVVVGNQWNNPNVQKGGPGEGPMEMYPNAAFHAVDGGHRDVLDDRNITLFSFDADTGELVKEGVLDTYNGTNGGPTTVAFNAQGTRLAVATWGIAHFATETPTNQKPSRVYVYDFDTAAGATSNTRFFEEEGIAGSIGFDWDRETSRLFVSNFNLVPEKRDHSVTVLEDTGNAVIKVATFGTGHGDDIDEACWTVLNPEGTALYVSSFGGNLISQFDIVAGGMLAPVGDAPETAFASRAPGTPAGDTKDMFVTGDGRFLYNLGAFQTFSIAAFEVSVDGSLAHKDEYAVAAAIEQGAGAYNFLGLVGFDK